MVIHLGETEWHDIRRKLTFVEKEGCKHDRLQYIEHGELLLCLDCKFQVTAIWALHKFFYQYERQKEELELESKRLQEERKTQIVHRAALKFQEMIRKRKYFPTCPHCYKAIDLDAQIFSGSKSKDYYKDEARPLVMKANLGLVEKDGE